MTTTFSDLQYDKCYPPGIEYHWWTRARNQLLANILRRTSGSTGTFLEVGCGKGVVVKCLHEFGFNIHGVELADVEPMEGAQLLVTTGTDACEWPIEHRSQITGLLLLDVIEHLPEPAVFLKKLEHSFPNLDVVIITVPGCHEIWSNFDVFCGHYRRYTLAMLDELAAELHWTTSRAGYFFRLPYLPMRLMSFLGIDRKTDMHPPTKVMRPFHGLVALACRFEQALLPRQIRGSSAYVVYALGRAGRQ